MAQENINENYSLNPKRLIKKFNLNQAKAKKEKKSCRVLKAIDNIVTIRQSIS